MSLSLDSIFTEEQLFSRLIVHGLDVDEDIVIKAKQGDSTAICAIADMYYDQLNYENAIIWYAKAAAKNKAQNRLGVIYDKGYGVTTNYQTALKWFEKASEQGYPEASVHAGNFYFYGVGTNVNKEVALAYYFKGAIKQFPEAMWRIGSVLVERNKRNEAVIWYKRSADLGFEDAKKDLEKLTNEGHHLGMDQRSILNMEERLHDLEKRVACTSNNQVVSSTEFNDIIELTKDNKKKLDEANGVIQMLEKRNEEHSKAFERKARDMKKSIATLEEKSQENDQLKERITVLENNIQINDNLVDQVKVLERLVSSFIIKYTNDDENTNEDITSNDETEKTDWSTESI